MVLNLDKSKILLFGKELRPRFDNFSEFCFYFQVSERLYICISENKGVDVYAL